MSYRGPKVSAWEKTLGDVFDRVDAVMEARHGELYPRHPSRPPHGSPAAPPYDGLFNIGASYSRGIGSQHGPGYVMEVRVGTTRPVSADMLKKLEDEAAELVRTELQNAYPGRSLEVERDGKRYKIFGDLGL